MGVALLAGVPLLLLLFHLKPSSLGWLVLGVAGAACLAVAALDGVRARRRSRVARV